MADFTFKQGDRVPALNVTLSDANGPADLTLSTSIRFQMEKKGTRERVIDSTSVTIVTPPGVDGVVTYQWQLADTDDWGLFRGVFVVTFPAGESSFPSDGYIEISIQRDLSKFP